MTVRLVRTLHDANVGRVDPQGIAEVMGYLALGQMPSIIGISLFIATVSVLSRMYRDSEMDVWHSSGTGLGRFVTPLYQFALPLLIAVAALQWWVWPWTNGQIQELRQRFEQRADIERVTPGEFQESAKGDRVFFVEKNASNETVANSLFLLDQSSGAQVVITARSSATNHEGGGTVLNLVDGERVQHLPDEQGLRVIQFATLSTELISEAGSRRGASATAMSTSELMSTPRAWAKGELAWRAGVVLLSANLVLLGLAIARVNPRMGGGGSIAMASLIAIIYFNFTTLSQSWVASGRVGLGAALLGLHGGIFVLTVLWLMQRHHQWGWRVLLPWSRRTSGSAA